MAEQDPYTVDRATLRNEVEHLIHELNTEAMMGSVDINVFIDRLLRTVIDGKTEGVVLRCAGGCVEERIPGESHIPTQFVPEEDCPVHGRSYVDVWRLAAQMQGENRG